MKFRIKEGKYLQIGFNYKKRWHNIAHLGTPEKILKEMGIPVPEEYQNILNKINQEKVK